MKAPGARDINVCKTHKIIKNKPRVLELVLFKIGRCYKFWDNSHVLFFYEL